MDGFPLGVVPELSLHEAIKPDQLDVSEIFRTWLANLSRCIEERSFENAVPELFNENCWWRDLVALVWDLRSRHGHKDIVDHLATSRNTIKNLKPIATGGLKPVLMTIGPKNWIQAGFRFQTPHGKGRGIVRLANVAETEWKAWTVSTQLEKLNFEEQLEEEQNRHSPQLPVNGINGVNGHDQAQPDGPQVLIIGAGKLARKALRMLTPDKAQSGLALAARLKNMRISTILVDQHPRVGDSWRTRYKTVTLHTPTYTDHYPFLKFPENWPKFLTQDFIADFMEHYAKIMRLDILLKTTVTKIDRDKSSKRFHVEIRGPQGSKTLTVRHVVLATGVLSNEPILPEFSNQDSFHGEMYHSSRHNSAGLVPQVHNKKVAVVGMGPSGHDIAQDFVNHGAKQVTMVQRSPIFSLSTLAFEKIVLGLWDTEGISTAEADVIGSSLPIAVIRRMSINMTKMMAGFDAAMVKGLKDAGVALETGENGFGLADHQLIKGGQFYIDQGANQMIIDRQIKIARCEEGIKDFQPDGFTLADGVKVDADIVVLATGFQKNIVTVKNLMGEEIAKKMGNFGQLDAEQERTRVSPYSNSSE